MPTVHYNYMFQKPILTKTPRPTQSLVMSSVNLFQRVRADLSLTDGITLYRLGYLQRGCHNGSAKHIIPEAASNAKSMLIIHEVMLKVVFL